MRNEKQKKIEVEKRRDDLMDVRFRPQPTHILYGQMHVSWTALEEHLKYPSLCFLPISMKYILCG